MEKVKRRDNALITKRIKIQTPLPTKAAVKTWLQTLPLTNIHLSVRCIIITLRKLKNSIDQRNPNSWFEILELVHPSIDYFTSHLRRKYLIDLTPHIQKEKKRYIILAYLLQNEMAACYSRLANPTFITSQYRELITISTYRVICYLTQIIVGSYELYIQPPKNIWQQLNKLYFFAEQNNIEEDSIRDISISCTTDKITIVNAYKRALLLCTANPSQLSRNDIGKLYEALGKWSKRTALYRNHDTNHLYTINLDSKEGPYFKALTPSNTNTKNSRILDTTELCGYLQDNLNQHMPDTSTILFSEEKLSLNNALIQTLLQNWNQRQMRFAKRTPHQGELGVCVGLSATHFYLHQENNPLSIAGLHHQPTSSTPQHAIHLWHIVNKSQHGYCLQLTDQTPTHVQPGVIMGIQEKNKYGVSSWQIYAIRWVQSNHLRIVHVGIELLSIHADPVTLEGSRQIRQLRGLLIDEVIHQTQVKTLIIPVIPYKTGDIVRVSSINNQYLVKLVQQLVSNHSYSQFNYLLLSKGHLR